MTTKEQLQIVIVGHVDHGKSTLVGRLLHDTDSLPDGKYEEVKKLCELQGKEMEFAYIMDAMTEEQEQNVTIDVAHIYFQTPKREYGIIDAPGHREFIKNMITGASQAEAAILIVDAVDGVQEQTRRHAYILHMLGLNDIIVLVNKMDAVKYLETRFKDVSKDIATFLDTLGIRVHSTIPLSARTGDNVAHTSENMTWYTGKTFVDTLDEIDKHVADTQARARLPIQDVYKIDGKRISVGRVESGTFKTGQSITVLPSGEVTEIKSIEEFLKPDKTTGTVGECIGITTKDPLFIDRGNVIASTPTPPVVRELRANLFWLCKEPLSRAETVTVKCSTQTIRGTIEHIHERIDSSTLEVLGTDADVVKNREVGKVTISLLSPMIIDDIAQTPELGRFVIERDNQIVGGGIIRT